MIHKLMFFVDNNINNIVKKCIFENKAIFFSCLIEYKIIELFIIIVTNFEIKN